MSEVIELLKKTGAFVANDHFVGTSGGHIDTYINKDALFPHVAETSRMGRLFAEKVAFLVPDVVAAPALGGIVLSQWTAYHLSEILRHEVLSVYTEKHPEKGQAFARGYDAHVKDKRVVVIEDLTTTGRSVMTVVEAVRGAGGEVAGVCVMVNKNPDQVNAGSLGVPFMALVEYPVALYSAFDCPLCKRGMPVNTKLGHGKKFLEQIVGKKTP